VCQGNQRNNGRAESFQITPGNRQLHLIRVQATLLAPGFRASESCIATDVPSSGSVGKLVNKPVSADSLPSGFIRSQYTGGRGIRVALLHNHEETTNGDESRTAQER
jgi:hypothetical protein